MPAVVIVMVNVNVMAVDIPPKFILFRWTRIPRPADIHLFPRNAVDTMQEMSNTLFQMGPSVRNVLAIIDSTIRIVGTFSTFYTIYSRKGDSSNNSIFNNLMPLCGSSRGHSGRPTKMKTPCCQLNFAEAFILA